jgi:hypothetical protein
LIFFYSFIKEIIFSFEYFSGLNKTIKEFKSPSSLASNQTKSIMSIWIFPIQTQKFYVAASRLFLLQYALAIIVQQCCFVLMPDYKSFRQVLGHVLEFLAKYISYCQWRILNLAQCTVNMFGLKLLTVAKFARSTARYLNWMVKFLLANGLSLRIFIPKVICFWVTIQIHFLFLLFWFKELYE